jgi:hypothetical protein
MQDRTRYGNQGSVLLVCLDKEGVWTMIVYRTTFNVKQGRMEELAALAKAEMAAERERTGYSHAVRIYKPDIGRFDIVAIEYEYEDLGQYERTWAEWAARSTTAEFMKKWLELTEPGGIGEIWTVEEA